jgi:hypothetical protein
MARQASKGGAGFFRKGEKTSGPAAEERRF